MFQFSRRENSVLQSSQRTETLTENKVATPPSFPRPISSSDFSVIISQTNIASACPYCINYNSSMHQCDLYGEPIPPSPDMTNPCKGNTFSKKQFSGNRLAQLRALRGE